MTVGGKETSEHFSVFFDDDIQKSIDVTFVSRAQYYSTCCKFREPQINIVITEKWQSHSECGTLVEQRRVKQV